MSFEQFAAILRARWLMATATFLAIMALVGTYAVLAPRSYTATSTVLVDVKPDPILGAVLNGGSSMSYLMTQVDVLSSRRVALRALKLLNLSRTPELNKQWEQATGGKGEFNAWLADLLRSGIQAQPSRGSNVVTITYAAADPNFASGVTNAIVQAYLDTTMELRAAPARQYNDFFGANAKQLKDRLEAAQTKLSEYQQSEELLATDERIDVETNRLNELSTQYVGMQAQYADSRRRQQAAQTQGDKSPDVMSNPLVSTLKADLLKAETQLEQVETRFGSEHPSVIELKTNIADTRQKLEAEIRRVTSSVAVNSTVTAGRLADTKAALDAQRVRVLKLKAIRDQAALLQQDVTNAQRAYEGVIARQNTSNLESQAAPVSVSVLEYAAPPVTPSSPRIKQVLGFGFVIALVLAAAIPLLIEQFNRKLRTSREAESLLTQSVIAVIPSFKRIKPSMEVPRRLRLQAPQAVPSLSK